MGSSKTSVEVRNERIETLGKEFGLLYDSIYNEFLWLSIKWLEYIELYGTKKSRIDILNSAAPSFFYTIQKILWENILLGICKLTDHSKSRGKKNVSVNSLLDFIDDEILKNNVKVKTNELMEATIFCRDWRNRYISHTDYFLTTDENAKPLEVASKEKMNLVFTLFQELINIFQNHYFNVTTAFDMVENRKGAISLLYVLDEGIESRKIREDRIRSGIYSESDLRRKSI
jgi:hypothetical protein